MDKFIRNLCDNFLRPKCNPEVRKQCFPKELFNDDPVPIDQINEALDKICMICAIGLIEVKKWECPICESHDIERDKMISSKSGVGGPFNARYYYQCNECGRKLVSYNIELNNTD